ncbi:aminotransferase class I/II-fold pyridoxal phosphate-dependent enzyme [Amycolatopsis regifaucium]|uniref:Ornithine decarboxylase n=1 Tax=Amycolatopsis regifaucium TaxID=546365 RepID=A0A154M3X0_9PSEU|nr:ornithine decarboxylase [Amycolatopsis regifaucium]KZB79315.1 ornithine decarboxylase [Amycolatopsis regifaucium]OKA07498.1 ornithine decarboxylase [Amycolatopsis regifaucium]SFH10061.1 Arginine/lysine/ornithine decarboxylase [Amycolatopsis regifaucium]
MDHRKAPVLEALREYRDRGFVPFNAPGHKQGRGVDPRVLEVVGPDVFASDVIALNGLDDRLMRAGVLAEAQKLMADAVSAEHTFFSTCGSSLSVKSAMLSVAGPHEKLLVPRHAHKSVIAGLIISGVCPVWVRPRWDTEQHLTHPPGPQEFAAAFEDEPEAKGALMVTPTDYGTCGDIRAVADACHDRGIPLIVDEAWGAHLPFHDDLPPWAMDAGADVCVTSVHKMGAAVEQSSVFHLQGDRVDPNVLKAREDLLGTTSPSSLVYATLDGWRRQMALQGKELLAAALKLVSSVRQSVAEIGGLRVLHDEFLGPRLADSVDPLKVVMDVRDLGISGYQAADWLREHRDVTVGLSDHRRIVAQFNHSDDEKTATVLLDALEALTEADLPAPPEVRIPDPADFELETAMLPRDAFFGPAEQVAADRAVGRICAEMITPYPPGAPAVLPGEVLTEPILDYLRSGLGAGMELPDPADAELKSVRVVARR